MLKQRVLTSLILIPIMIGGIFYLPLPLFSIFIAIIIMAGAWEWANLAGMMKQRSRLLYATSIGMALVFANGLMTKSHSWALVFLFLGFLWWLIAFYLVRCYPESIRLCEKSAARALVGFFVLVPMWVGLVSLKQMENSTPLIIYLMIIIWGADIGAYVVGRAIGGRKLAPNVSPGKSWAGVYGGLATTTVVALCCGIYVSLSLAPLSLKDWLLLLFVTGVTVAVSILGDLLESMFKRYRGIKDSSGLLPGHGGVMDRIDSMSAAVPIFALALLLVGWGE